MNIPERKISETLLEFGERILGLLEEPTVEEYSATINIVIVVWNAHGLSMATGSGRSAHLEELTQFRQRMAEKGAPAIVLADFDALDASRATEYAGDPRCVGEWELLSDGADGFKLRCDARLLGSLKPR